MSANSPTVRDIDAIAMGKFDIRLDSTATYIAQVTAQLTKTAHSIGAIADQAIAGEKEFHQVMHDFPQKSAGTIALSEMFNIEVSPREITPFTLGLAQGLDPFGVTAAAYSEIKHDSAAGTYTEAKLTFPDNTGTISDRFTFVFYDATHFYCISSRDGLVQDGSSDGEIGVLFAPDNAVVGAVTYFSLATDFFAGTWAAGESLVIDATAYKAAGADLPNTVGAGGSIALGNISSPVFLRCEAHLDFPNGTDKMYIILPRIQIESPTSLSTSVSDEASTPMVISAKSADSSVSGGNAVWDSMPYGRIYFS